MNDEHFRARTDRAVELVEPDVVGRDDVVGEGCGQPLEKLEPAEDQRRWLTPNFAA